MAAGAEFHLGQPPAYYLGSPSGVEKRFGDGGDLEIVYDVAHKYRENGKLFNRRPDDGAGDSSEGRDPLFSPASRF